MDSRSPLSELSYEAENRSQMPYHYTPGVRPHPLQVSMSITFEFYRYRFHFRAVDPVHFPQGKTANMVRGAFGSVLRDAVPPAVYARLFQPGASLGHAPSGL